MTTIGVGGGSGSSENVGTSNAFIGGQFGGAYAGGTSGGNSSAAANLNINAMEEAVGVVQSIGRGEGASGGYGVFGPSLAAAIAAATPPPPDLTSNPVTTVTDSSSKNGKGKKGQAAVVSIPVEAPPALVFTFTPGLQTGGGGAGFGLGFGKVNATVASLDDANAVDFAEGEGTATGFGFGVGNGGGINVGGESGGGNGGGTALGGGTIVFEVDEVAQGGYFNSEGLTTSQGGSAGYVGFAPVIASNIFDRFLTLPP
jgi:hypothetical protein